MEWLATGFDNEQMENLSGEWRKRQKLKLINDSFGGQRWRRKNEGNYIKHESRWKERQFDWSGLNVINIIFLFY